MGNVLVLAIAAAFYPTLLAIVIVALTRPRPVRLLGAYLAGGLLISIAIGCVIVFVLQGSVAGTSAEPTVSPVVDLVAGALTLGLAWILWSGRDPRPARLRRKREAAAPSAEARPSWSTRALGRDSLAIAFALGLVLDLPSVWYLVALKDIATGDHSTTVAVLQILLFNVVMFTLVEIPLVAYLLAPERAEARVRRANAWLHSHARQLGVAIAAAIGTYLIAKGVLALA